MWIHPFFHLFVCLFVSMFAHAIVLAYRVRLFKKTTSHAGLVEQWAGTRQSCLTCFFFFFFFFFFFRWSCSMFADAYADADQGPVVQSVVNLTSSSRVISLTVLADSTYNILIFFAEKMWVAFAVQKLLTFFFQQKISAYLHITRCKF